MKTETQAKPEMKTPKPKGKRRGRPPGSKNRDYADVVVYPPKCPSCNRAIDTNSGKQYRQVDYHHRAEDGTITNVVRWYRIQCQCSQWISYRRHEFDAQVAKNQNK